MIWIPLALSAGIVALIYSSRSRVKPPSRKDVGERYIWPIGTIVDADIGYPAGEAIEKVKIIGNTRKSGLGDYEVISADCDLPFNLCPSEWIEQGTIR